MSGFDRSELTLPEIWASHARRLADKPALVCGGQSLSWAGFGEAMNRLANGLIAKGVVKGDRVAVLVQASIDAIVAMFGTTASGAVLVPASTMLAAAQVATVLRDSGARVVIACADYRHLVPPQDELPDLVDGGLIATDFADVGWHSLEDVCAAIDAKDPAVALAGDDLFSIMYSSGTTGSPKGVVHTHSARTYFAISNGFEMRYDSDSVGLVSTALYTAGTWLVVLPTLLVGGTLHIHSRFDSREQVAAWKDHGVTHCFLVPSQIRAIFSEGLFEDCTMPRLKVLLSAGSPLRQDEKMRLIECVGDRFYELYGFTEGSSTLLAPADQQSRPFSVGRPLLGQEIVIIGEDGRRQAPDLPGEIAGRGPGLLARYWGRPQETEDAIWRDEAGRSFVRSGDIGRLDPEGFLYILDRKKDMIISGGLNIYPADLEAVLSTHPDVADASVVGRDHPRWGETPVGFVVARDPRVDAESLKQWANDRLAKHQRLSEIIVRDNLPRNALGKVLKRKLRDELASIAAE